MSNVKEAVLNTSILMENFVHVLEIVYLTSGNYSIEIVIERVVSEWIRRLTSYFWLGYPSFEASGLLIKLII